MNRKSFKFKSIDNNLVKLLTLLCTNVNISRYIYYLDDEPLNPLKEDVSVDLIEDGYILLTMFDPKVLIDYKVRVFLNPFEGSFLSERPLSEIVYTLDIIIPNENWRMKGSGGLRAYRIADEFSQLVDGQMVAGIGEVNVASFKTYKVNEKYSGLTLFIEVNSSNLKGLR